MQSRGVLLEAKQKSRSKKSLRKLYSLNVKAFLQTLTSFVLFSTLFTVSYNAATKNLNIFKDVRDNSFPSLENIDKAIFQVEKLKETFQAIIATQDEDEIESAEKIAEKIRSSLKKVAEADPDSKLVVEEIEQNFESYFEKSSEISKKFIDEELSFSSAGEELRDLVAAVNSLDAKLKDFRSSSYKRFTSSIDEANRSSLHSQNAGLIMLIIGSIVSILLLIGVQKIVVKPIIEVSKASHQVELGNYDVAIRNKSLDEIGFLSRNFNKMVTKLKSHNQQLDFIRKKNIIISKSYSFTMLNQNVTETFSEVCHFDGIRIFLSSSCFIGSKIENGFYLVDKNGEPDLSTLKSFSNDSTQDPETKNEVFSFDSKTNELISVVEIESENIDESNYKILNAFSGSIANAISTIKLAAAKNLIELKSAKISTIFENIEQGICTISADGNISPEYSKHLEVILGEQDLQDKNLFDIIFAKADLGADSMAAARAAVFSSYGEWVDSFFLNSDHLPRSFCRTVSEDKLQYLQLDWLPLSDVNQNIVSIMVTIRDTTELHELEEQANRSKQKSDMIVQVSEAKDFVFNDIISRCVKVKEFLQTLSEKVEVANEEIIDLKRDLHTIKGNARATGFTYLTDNIHELEQKITDLKKDTSTGQNIKGKHLKNLDLEKFTAIYSAYQNVYENILNRSTKKTEKLSGLDTELLEPAVGALSFATKTRNTAEIDHIVHYLRSLVQGVSKVGDLIDGAFIDNLKVAKDLGLNDPNLQTIGIDGILIRNSNRAAFVDCLNHLFGNSFYHGFRKQENTKEHEIRIKGQIEANDFLVIKYQDSGPGLSIDGLRKKAASAYNKSEKNISTYDIIKIMFESGVSTADKVNQVAGRGVGLDIIRSNIEKMGGSLDVELLAPCEPHTKFIPFMTIISIPAKEIVTIPDQINTNSVA